jgi:hypothetical protein
MFDNFVSALGDRFRQQYPQGSIISDLVQIHGDQYVVKVSVSLENTVLVSTLAADANLMLAENRALERALTILGIRDLQQPANEPVNLPTNFPVTPLPDLPTGLTNSVEPPQATVAATVVVTVANESTANSNLLTPVATLVETVESPIIIEEPSLPQIPVIPAAEPIRIQVGIAQQPVSFAPAPSFSEPETETTMPIANGIVAIDPTPSNMPAVLPDLPIENSPEVPEISVAKSSRTKKSPAPPDPLPAASTDDAPLDETMVPIAYFDTAQHQSLAPKTISEPPLSVTDMIPMINMELKRLGWSKDRGRDYMVSLYNKRASALLSDDELFGLLQHLQAEPVV